MSKVERERFCKRLGIEGLIDKICDCFALLRYSAAPATRNVLSGLSVGLCAGLAVNPRNASLANQISLVLYTRSACCVLHYLTTMEQTEEASLEEVSVSRILSYAWLTLFCSA